MQHQVGSPTRRLQRVHDVDVAVLHSEKSGARVFTPKSSTAVIYATEVGANAFAGAPS
jgi:hypothetical protein